MAWSEGRVAMLPDGINALLVDTTPAAWRVRSMASARYGQALMLEEGGVDAVDWLSQNACDILLLDVTSFAGSAADAVMLIQARLDADAPIILLGDSRLHTEFNAAMEVGADDYMTAPFDHLAVLVRCRAVLRRQIRLIHRPSSLLIRGEYCLDLTKRVMLCAGVRIKLTAKEFLLAKTFLRYCGKTLSRELLGRLVWGDSFDVMSRTLDTHIHRLRKKLGWTLSRGWHLSSVYCRGYRLMEPGELSRDRKSASAHPVRSVRRLA
ncbi:response regulator transcription factor [Pandoraea cepalis]|nr:response regulator transcription factor [Pandoraea cepalis]